MFSSPHSRVCCHGAPAVLTLEGVNRHGREREQVGGVLGIEEVTRKLRQTTQSGQQGGLVCSETGRSHRFDLPLLQFMR